MLLPGPDAPDDPPVDGFGSGRVVEGSTVVSVVVGIPPWGRPGRLDATAYRATDHARQRSEVLTPGAPRPSRSATRLFTSTVAANVDGELIVAFRAIVAREEAEVRDRIADRHGSEVGEAAQVTIGFDRSDRIARALVSEPVAELLERVAADPGSLLARGLDIALEQRFAS